MAIRDKIAANAQPHLQPGEQIQAAFSGQTHSQMLMALMGLPFLIMNEYRTVVATDRRILVFNSGKFSTTKASSVVAELPRGTRLGPASGLWHKMTVGNEQIQVHKRFHKDVEAADRAVVG